MLPGYVVCYVDETWVNSKIHAKWMWHRPPGDGPNKKPPRGKGSRQIVVAGLLCGAGDDKDGWAAFYHFKGDKTKKDGDYHKEMTQKVFEVQRAGARRVGSCQLWVSVPPRRSGGPSCWRRSRRRSDRASRWLVIDNAPSHNGYTLETKRPDRKAKREEWVQWCVEKGVEPPEGHGWDGLVLRNVTKKEIHAHIVASGRTPPRLSLAKVPLSLHPSLPPPPPLPPSSVLAQAGLLTGPAT